MQRLRVLANGSITALQLAFRPYFCRSNSLDAVTSMGTRCALKQL
jgi:hypothetical protein